MDHVVMFVLKWHHLHDYFPMTTLTSTILLPLTTPNHHCTPKQQRQWTASHLTSPTDEQLQLAVSHLTSPMDE